MMEQMLNMFDPSTSNLTKMNWMFLALPTVFPFLIKHHAMNNKLENMFSVAMKQLTAALFPLSKLTTPFTFTCFSMLAWNMTGLLPFNFTMTTQFMMTMSMAMPLWSTPFFNSLLTKYWWPSHLTPANLPALALAVFMSFMELVSCYLRPMTLSLRLMINLTAGHLILSLVALAQSTNLSKTFFIVGGVMLMFIVLEMAVAFMQSYVFSMLTLLYSKEN